MKMAATVVRLSTQFRYVKQPLINIVRRDLAVQHAVPTLSTTCIQCKCYHVTPVYFKKLKEQIKIVSVRNAKKDRPLVSGWNNMTVQELARSANKPMDDVFEALMYLNRDVDYHPHSVLDQKVIDKILDVLGCNLKVIGNPTNTPDVEEDHEIYKRSLPDPSMLVKRRPVVTVMGHIDHGKTTLLDALRNTSVVQSEFGGITQHIGAFNVKLKSGDVVTFLDTPGHAAFSAMRSRGAQVTDIVVLVVAADDGVMEQTVQSIQMAEEAGVPIIVAINKIDKHGADIPRIQSELSQHGVQVEELGGDVQCVEISALKKTNLDMLTEMIVLQADLMGIKGDPAGLAEGVVLECTNDSRRGKLVTVLIQRGKLRRGSLLVAGLASCKVRSMFDHNGQIVREAGLSDPVQIIGWKDLPSAGEEVLEVESEKVQKMVMRFRHNKTSQQIAEEHQKAADIKHAIHNDQYQKLLAKKRELKIHYLPIEEKVNDVSVENPTVKVNVVVKGDVAGSVEAILDVLDTYKQHDKCALNVIHYGVGEVIETDLEFAEMFDAIIYYFNTKIPKKLQEEATKKGIKVRKYNVIYKLIDDIKNEISNCLPLLDVEEIIGEANVQQKFEITEGKKKVNVAGCRCTKGILKKDAQYRLVRNGEVIYTGQLVSMRHLKQETKTIKVDTECGLRFADPYVDVQPGDVLVCFTVDKRPQVIDWNTGF